MKTIKVQTDTKLSDLKVGDLVITAEIHRVTHISTADECGPYDKNKRTNIFVTNVKPQCGSCKSSKCKHERVMTVGWGQQCIQKIIEETTPRFPSKHQIKPKKMKCTCTKKDWLGDEAYWIDDEIFGCKARAEKLAGGPVTINHKSGHKT